MQGQLNGMDVGNKEKFQNVWPGLAADSLVALQAAIAVMLSDKLTWFPEFGCALLALGKVGAHATDSRPDLDALTIHLLCLDSWKFKIHRLVQTSLASQAITITETVSDSPSLVLSLQDGAGPCIYDVVTRFAAWVTRCPETCLGALHQNVLHVSHEPVADVRVSARNVILHHPFQHHRAHLLVGGFDCAAVVRIHKSPHHN